ncbi:hypothetical protein XCR1_2620008 [Xenorhabdus cabanillasii JM26]|uniref:Uncharacterized protein n=1 Tax=Xenorhabdus cabanillasii JM26 TaxID=1427517 RepID=W1J8R5_9GAMM|nr:hypothetical protein XCR1_2620008 [Xenorhabdus cabanillasii JM26]
MWRRLYLVVKKNKLLTSQINTAKSNIKTKNETYITYNHVIYQGLDNLAEKKGEIRR